MAKIIESLINYTLEKGDNTIQIACNTCNPVDFSKFVAVDELKEMKVSEFIDKVNAGEMFVYTNFSAIMGCTDVNLNEHLISNDMMFFMRAPYYYNNDELISIKILIESIIDAKNGASNESAIGSNLLSVLSSTHKAVASIAEAVVEEKPKSTKKVRETLSAYKVRMWKEWCIGKAVQPYYKKRVPETERKNFTDLMTKLINFFRDFDNTSISPRQVDTIMRISSTWGFEQVKSYVGNYYELIDHPCKDAIRSKLTCDEFRQLIFDITSEYKGSKNPINSRLKIYYGNAGGGKTTQAMKEITKPEYNMTCSPAWLPDDLMQTFTFTGDHEESAQETLDAIEKINDRVMQLKKLLREKGEAYAYTKEVETAIKYWNQCQLKALSGKGQARFVKSLLWKAMENGWMILMDEIRLLSNDCFTFLQGICDGKEITQYKGELIRIKPGFKIIGTMNLKVNGVVYALPEPIVDRCSEIKFFDITPDYLGNIIEWGDEDPEDDEPEDEFINDELDDMEFEEED